MSSTAILATDLEVVNYGSDYVPSKNGGVANSLKCTAAGTVILDTYGLGGKAGVPGSTNVSVPMIAGEILPCVFVKIHSGSTGSYVALF